MKHTSVLLDSPIEFIESTKISPFISKVQIKVCYVGDEPNRNNSIITKEVARQMAPSLRGCPIVGFFNESNGDFEEHNRQINISNGEWRISDTTTPYGFVPTDAKIWFATYLDDGAVEHEYLCTEGFIWDHVYPEAKRIITDGNNQSMELDEETLDATWSKDSNEKPQFFIINEALISKLCILGENCEPCFEGSQITSFSLVIDEDFQKKMYSMMNEIKELLTKGGTKVFNTYAVEIGDTLWSTLYDYLVKTYPDTEDRWCSQYSIDGIYEEDGQKFAILYHRTESKYYRLNFSITETEGFTADAELVEVTKTYVPAAEPQFDPAAVEAYKLEYANTKNEENQDKTDEENISISEDSSEETKFSYNTLEEIPEYVELQTQYAALTEQVTQLTAELNASLAQVQQLQDTLKPLQEFKANAVHKEKEAMIAKFYMLSDEDKKDVIDNIDTYSLDDIEAKLSIICVRNKVNFIDNDKKDEVTTFNLSDENDDSATPAWVKAVLDVAKNMK